MADKKNKRPMTASDYVKNQPHLQGKPLTIQNPYSALAEFPPLSNSKAVASDKGWFNEWWHSFGPCDQIYPPELLKTAYPYYLKHIPKKTLGPYQKIIFHADMGIPWICSWYFNLILALPDMPYSLVKEYRVKWWDKYNLDRCSLSNIQKNFNSLRQDYHLVQSISKSIPLLTPSQLTKPSPTSTPAKPPSPTKSSKSTSSTSSRRHKKKAKLQQALQTLNQELLASSDDEESIHNEDHSNTEEDPFGGPLGQDLFADIQL
ncbi:unnamed protein product [Arabis nemorensis]|uniref:Uncharacterized protein n=1 Tax=Arabis nemorensis TaxID=586526 RepID=A0A565CAV8_9BRAS|nr:unnamed protein product [Arabis nemorensis]